MTHSTDLLALEKRIGEAGEGSRKLDSDVYEAATGTQCYFYRDWTFDHRDDAGVFVEQRAVPPVTTSLDAALALAERKLTECGKSRADILNWILEAMEEVGSGNIVSAFALAVCLALVRALAHNPAVEK